MLIWIKPPYAAIGVLASFVLLLSTVVSEQRDLNTTSDDTNNTFTIQEEFDSVQIMNLPFAQSLRNPCSWDSTYNRPSHLNFMGPRAKFIKEFFTFVRHYSRMYKEDVEAMLRSHSIPGCANLHVDSLPDTPTLAELQDMPIEQALNKIYLSLLVHSAYSFVIHYQVNSTDVRCSNDIQREKKLADQSYAMALKQKALACYVLVGMTVLGYEKEDITPLLSVRVSHLSLCSRRALRECQVLNSARRFLQILQNYAAEDIRESSTRLHDSISSTTSTVPVSSTVSSITPSSIISVSSTTSSSTIPISSTVFTSSFISTPSAEHSSTTSSQSSIRSTSTIISTLLTTSSSFEFNTSSARPAD